MTDELNTRILKDSINMSLVPVLTRYFFKLWEKSKDAAETDEERDASRIFQNYIDDIKEWGPDKEKRYLKLQKN